MNRPMPRPCNSWAEQLAALHPTDLTSDEREALAAHLAICPGCTAMRATYRRMDAQIRRLPDPQPLVGLPPRLLQLWEEEDRRAGVSGSALAGRFSGDRIRLTEHIGDDEPAPVQFNKVHRRRPRAISWVSSLAAVLVIALLIAALLASHTTATPTGTPARQWIPIHGLLHTKDLPVLAPSNPRFVYKINKLLTNALGEPQLQHSPDAGATWQTLDMPTITPGVVLIAERVQPSVFINPLNANMVFLTLPRFDTTAPDQCLSPGQFDKNPCTLQYYSMDDGENWYPLHLPLPGVLGDPTYFDNPSLELFASQRVLRAQGKRLYSTIGGYNQGGVLLGSNGARLVTSTDGGMTWQVADKSLADHGQLVCDYAPAPTGSTVFALTESGVCGGSPTDLWRSDDAGQHWTRVGALPGLAARGLSVVSQGNAAQPLLYLNTQNLGAQVDTQPILQVSTDGGKTWTAAPNPAPTTGRWFVGPVGVLGDGSVIVASLPVLGKAAATFIAWKAGERAWRQLAPPVDNMTYLLVTPDAAASGSILWVVISTGQDIYSVYRY